MFRSRAAWLNSKPGSRWRTVALPFATTPVTGFKFAGGYFLALRGTANIITVQYSADLINWSTANLLGSVSPPILDATCDGTYIYYAYKTSPSATTCRLVRREIATGISNDIAISNVIRTLSVRTGGTLFYTYVGGYGYISTWPTIVTVADAYVINPIGFVDIPGSIDGLLVNGPSGSTVITSVKGSTNATGLNVIGFSTTSLGGTLTDVTVLGPVYNPVATSPVYSFLYLYKFTIAELITFTTIGAAQNNGMIVSGNALGPSPGGFPGLQTPCSMALDYASNEIYVATIAGEVLKTADYNNTWRTVFSGLQPAPQIVSSNKGIVIVERNGNLRVSP